ncbi:MAG: hypothetical protein HETSPECPRED_010236 [Heterodermia speciosa]|uniref:Uncharacterized protein n=1 Tax=Heterodermia speciosa TaxID=116794 RepID=A0A8H3EPC3_9LECA|nr:MAG: hypothetical protein HETSPECPRED_010236 [Heterodermia speciosa]
MEAFKSTASTDLTTYINSSNKSPAVSSETTPQSRYPGHRPSTLATSTSGSVNSPSLTDLTSASRAVASPSTASATQSSATPTDSSSGTTDFSNNNLSKGGQIAIGVVLPVLTLIVGLVFGIRAWSRKVHLSTRRSIKPDEVTRTDMNAKKPQQRNGQGTDPLRRQMTDMPQNFDQGWI